MNKIFYTNHFLVRFFDIYQFSVGSSFPLKVYLRISIYYLVVHFRDLHSPEFKVQTNIFHNDTP